MARSIPGSFPQGNGAIRIGAGEKGKRVSFTELLPDDLARPHPDFIEDEAAYQLFHAIVHGDCAHKLRSEDGKMMYAQSVDYKGWLWLSRSLAEKERSKRIEALCALLGHNRPPGIISDPDTAEQFSKTYTSQHGMNYQVDMSMEAYTCPLVGIVSGVAGESHLAGGQDIRVVAEFLAGFSQDAYGNTVTAESQLQGAERLIAADNLYLWLEGDEVVSMANIAQRSPRHARINAVYTPHGHRKKGYASALVGELTRKVLNEGLTPMLYADLSNPHSNGVYRGLGYREQGKLTDIRFN